MYHDNRIIAVFKFGRPHMVRPVSRSENWNFPLNREGRVLLRSVDYSKYSKMASGARHKANLMNFVQESAEKDEIKLKMYVI